MTENPFQPSVVLEDTQSGYFGDGAKRLHGTLLFRDIQIESPVAARFVYDGWWFRQKITIDGQLVWFRISWLTIHREAEFTLPISVDAEQRPCRMTIQFNRVLHIRRFQIWIADHLIYDEIH